MMRNVIILAQWRRQDFISGGQINNLLLSRGSRGIPPPEKIWILGLWNGILCIVEALGEKCKGLNKSPFNSVSKGLIR